MLMPKLISVGRIMFALGLMALGILQFFTKDYIVARPPSPHWSSDIPGKLTWAYISGALLIISGLLIIVRKKAEWAALFAGIDRRIRLPNVALNRRRHRAYIVPRPGSSVDAWDLTDQHPNAL